MPPLLAPIDAGPLRGLGVGSLWLARVRSWPDALPPMVGPLVFALLAGLASTWHAHAFTAGLGASLLRGTWRANRWGRRSAARLVLEGPRTDRVV